MIWLVVAYVIGLGVTFAGIRIACYGMEYRVNDHAASVLYSLLWPLTWLVLLCIYFLTGVGGNDDEVSV